MLRSAPWDNSTSYARTPTGFNITAHGRPNRKQIVAVSYALRRDKLDGSEACKSWAW